ncbi:MAG: DUF285 domain-containing protein [Treponema sp.]|nr:DUF285 domain-containing protein [Treponema sp.]
MSNSDDIDGIIALFKPTTASDGSEGAQAQSVVLDADAIGLPAGGTVTLTITGRGMNYSNTAGADADGNVTFEIPAIVTGTEITVTLAVKTAGGTVLYAGSKTQVLNGEASSLDISLSRQYWTLPASLTVTANPQAILYGAATWTTDSTTLSISWPEAAPEGAAISYSWKDQDGTELGTGPTLTRTVPELTGGAIPAVTTSKYFSVTASYTDVAGETKTASGTVSVTVGVDFIATADKAVLTAGSTTAGDNTATITVTGSPAGSLSVTPAGTAASLIIVTPLTEYTWSVVIASDGSGEAWFADDTAVSVDVTDGSNAASISFTLKNKYTYSIADADGNPCDSAGGIVAGGTLSFATAKGAVEAVPGTVPTGREIVAFRKTAPLPESGLTKPDFPLTFNSTNFSARSINLKALLDFEMTVSGGHALGDPTPAGTEAAPYILKYSSSDTGLTCIDLTVSDYIGSLDTSSDAAGGELAIDLTNPATPAITINKTNLAASAIPAAGLKYKVTVKDYKTGADPSSAANVYASKDFWVQIPPIPDVVIKTGSNFNAVLKELGANASPNKTFGASPTPPPSYISAADIKTLSDPGSPGEMLVWLDGTSIKYYAEGYTDTGKKILLDADSSGMFSGCRYLTSIDVSGFDTRNVTNMYQVFNFCEALTNITGLDSWDTSNVTKMREMFYGCNVLSIIDLSSFDTHNVTSMYYMFYYCYALTTIYASENFVTASVTDSVKMFGECTNIKGGGTPPTSFKNAYQDKTYARIDGGSGSTSPGYFTLKP